MKVVSALLLLFLTFLYLGLPARASELKGAEISYNEIAPRIFVIEYRVYLDCQNPVFPATKTLTVTGAGCNSSRDEVLTHPATMTNPMGNPYCKAVGNGCAAGSLPNYTVVTYSGTIILDVSEMACTGIIFSVRECPGIQAANIAGAAGGCSTVEAFNNPALDNIRSPQIYDHILPFVTLNSPATVSFLVPADDWHNDSVEYRLKPVMDSLNVPASYSGNFTFANPLSSSAGVQLNAKTGMLTFTPDTIVHSTQPHANSYAVLVEMIEWRRVNNLPTKVGTSQKLITVQVVNNAPNINPEITNVTANGQPVLPNAIIELNAGDSLHFQFNTADANASDSVTILEPKRTLGTFTTTTGTRPSGSFRWKASQLLLPDQIVYVPVIIKDNACPVPGVTTQVYGIKVLANLLGIKDHFKSGINFTAFPNPFSESVNFKLNAGTKAETILIYNLLGQQIDEIQLKTIGSGHQKVQWQNAGKHAAGTYIAQLVSKDKTIQTLKFTKVQ